MWQFGKGKEKGAQQTQGGAQATVDEPAPREAFLELDTGDTIPCAVLEDPDRTADGYRQFWLEPMRELADGERAVSVHIDVLPGRSQAHVRWPDQGHHLHPPAVSHMTWEDHEGNRYTSDAGMDLLWHDPPEL